MWLREGIEMITLSDNDRITEILKRYSEQAEAEHAELFYKPTTNHGGRPRFICQNCSRMKMRGKVSTVTFYRLDKSILLFCDRQCFSHWLKQQHPKVTWKFDRRLYHHYTKPVETKT
jgi:hypothetical protein